VSRHPKVIPTIVLVLAVLLIATGRHI